MASRTLEKVTKKTAMLQKLAFAAVNPAGLPAVQTVAVTGKVSGPLETFTHRVLPVVRFFSPEARITVEASNEPGKLVVDGRVVEGAKSLGELTTKAFGVRVHVGPLAAAAKKKQAARKAAAGAASEEAVAAEAAPAPAA